MSEDLIKRDSVIKILHIIDEKLSTEQCDDKAKQCMYECAREMLSILKNAINDIPRANEEYVRFSDVAKVLDEGYEKGKADRPQEICEYGEYCMCATCHYQEDCSYCADCTEAKKQMHDIWTCTKYMRKEYLRKGSCDAPTIEIVVYGNCARCGKPIEGNSIFLCDECKSLMKGADNGADNI